MKRYGDAVVLVQKQSDGTLRRLNAIVLASSLHVPTTADRKPIKDAAGDPLPHAEHLDLAFAVPTLVPDGGVLKTRNVDEIFRLAYAVPEWTGDGWIGYEPDAEPEPIVEAQGSGSDRYDQDGDPYNFAEYLADSPHAKALAPAGEVVPFDQLLKLSEQVSKYDPELEVCPDAVVTSATTALAAAIAEIDSHENAVVLEDTHKEEIADAENSHGQGDEHQD